MLIVSRDGKEPLGLMGEYITSWPLAHRVVGHFTVALGVLVKAVRSPRCGTNAGVAVAAFLCLTPSTPPGYTTGGCAAMVTVAQSAERQIVALEVAGSSPVGHP